MSNFEQDLQDSQDAQDRVAAAVNFEQDLQDAQDSQDYADVVNSALQLGATKDLTCQIYPCIIQTTIQIVKLRCPD